MKLSSLNEWLTLGANLGVLIGLIFLIVELNQNTRVAQASAYQDLISGITDFNYLQASDDELADTIERGKLDFDSLTPEERGKLLSLKRIVYRGGDLAYYQYELGLIDDERLFSALGPLRGHLVDQAGRISWEEMRTAFNGDYVEYVENMMAEVEPNNNFWK